MPVGDVLRTIAVEQGRELLDGATGDLARYSEEITAGLAQAAAEGRDDLRDEILDQVQVIGERHRLRANHAAWEVFRRVLHVAFDVAKGV